MPRRTVSIRHAVALRKVASDDPRVRVVQQGLDLLAARDADGMADIVSPDADIVVSDGRFSGHRALKGLDGVREWIESLGPRFHSYRVEARKWEADGDLVLLTGVLVVQGEGTSGGTATLLHWLVRVHEGRIQAGQVFLSREAAADAASRWPAG